MSNRPTLFTVVFGALLASLLSAGFWAQPLAGQASRASRTIRDGVYTESQAERGGQRFRISCSSCHTPTYFSGGAFAERWNGQTMGEVFDFVSNTMPENDPGGLKPDEYASVLAFFLSINKYPAGTDELPDRTEALKQITIDSPSK